MKCRPSQTLFLLVAFGTITAPACLLAGEGSGWDPAAAARYLDTRAGAWEAFRGADRGQGADKVSCLSCHTSVSYALGRPALRKMMKVDGPTKHEERLLDQVRRRVEHWGELDTPRFRLAYDFDERKKVESWGTEAVLNTLILAMDDRRRGLGAPTDATREALRHLWGTQHKDGPDAGSWDWLDFGLRPWEAGEARYFGTALAAVAVGTVPGYRRSTPDAEARAGLERLRGYLRSHLDGQNLHNQLVVLWGDASIGDCLSAKQRREIIDRVLSRQQENGGWALPSLVECRRQDGTPQETAPDGYATGLALHVLQVAGVGRETPSVAPGLAWLRSHQQADGRWVGVSLNKRRDPKTHVGQFMSDAATAFALLALEDH